MSMKVHSSGVVLRQKSQLPDPPTDSLRYHQEIRLQPEIDCYSDGGYPTLPRPKVILPLPRPSSPWNAYQASQLQTFSVRVGSGRESRTRSSSLSVVECNRAKYSHRAKTANPKRSLTTKQTLNLESSEFSSNHENSVDDSGESDYSRAQDNNTSAICSKLKANRVAVDTVRETHSSNNRTAASKDRLTQSWSCPASQNSEGSTTVMSNHNRVDSRRKMDNSQAPGSKGKKTKKASRSLTFSFGSNSEKRKRSLGFFGTKPRRQSDDPGFLRIPGDTGMTPGSPILVGKDRGRGKSRTLPSSSRSTEFQRHCIMEERDSNSSLEDWGPEISSINHFGSCRDLTERSVGRPRYRSKHRPPRLSSGDRHTSHHDPLTDSPLTDDSIGDTYNTASEQSSRRDSIESPSFSLSSEPTQQLDEDGESAKECSREDRPHRERKLSDPASSSPDVNSQEGRRTLKKRNTFCVRPMKQSPIPGRRQMRHHVVRFLLETEQSYVQSLKTIIKVYLEPLNRPQAAGLADPTLVKDIFFQIPEVCTQHERFLQQLKNRVDHWDSEKMIGDIFVNTFSKCLLVDIYSKFIGNFMKAKAAIDIAKQSRPVFAKFLEQRAKDSQGRLTLDDLLIKPVQRIPRYVLFIKDLLKHTTTDHPDHAPLQQALSELTTLAERVNASERERGRIEQQRELMMVVDGLALLLNSESRFVRYDLVTEVANAHKRDRFLILFSDVLVCASTRRKSTGFKRSSFLNLTSVFTDALKYNIKWHVPLTKVSIAQIQAPSFNKRRQNTLEKMIETLHKDEATLKQMMDMSSSIHRPHQTLVNTLRDMLTEVREDISEKKAALDDLPLETGRLDIISYATSPPSQYSLLFPSQRLKSSWEADFLKHKTTADQQAPPNDMVAPPTSPPPVPAVSHDMKFLHPMVLQSGRVGTKLTCAAEGLPVDCDSSSCLWVACSDGYGGQVSLLDLHPSTHPQVVANITVSDSPILCMSAIPTQVNQEETEDPTVSLETDSRGFDDSIGPVISVQSFDSDSTSNASTMSESCDGHVTGTRTPSSASDGVEIAHVNGTIAIEKEESVPLGYMDPDLNAKTTPTHNKPHPHHTLSLGFQRVRSNSAPSGLSDVNVPERQTSSPVVSQMIKRGHQRQDSGTRLFSPLTLRPSDLGGQEGGCGHCMWLGTQSGQIHVYSAGDNLRSRSNRQTIQLPAAVHFIRYYNNGVYVGLGNGSLAVLDPQDPTAGPSHIIPVGVAPVLSSIIVDDQLWVSCGGSLYQLESPAKTVKAVVTLPSEQTIRDMVNTDGVVWIASQQSPVIHLYSASSVSHLTTIDCTKPVMDLLRGYNPIIRQHKSSTLQLTSLLATPTHLIAGTSAGILLSLPLPSVDSIEPHPPGPTPLTHGHVDPVHFISSMQREGMTLIISGGNGCEDFVATEMSQDVPETSSCLLVWTSA